MSKELFVRIRVQGFRGSEYDSQVFEFTKDIQPKTELIKETVKELSDHAIDKGAEELLIDIVQMRKLLPRKEK